MIPAKQNYENEYGDLVREQYKRLPRFSMIMEALGAQGQEIETALSDTENLNNALSIVASAPRDALNRTAVMFGIAKPQEIQPADLVREIQATLVVVFGRCLRGDIQALLRALYNFTADIQEVGDGFYVSIFQVMTRAQGKGVFRYLRRLVPAGMALHGIIQGGPGFFGFSGFGSLSGQTRTPAGGVSPGLRHGLPRGADGPAGRG